MRAPWPWHDEWTEEHLADSRVTQVTQTHRLIRPLTPKGWIREANCSATSKWAGSNAKSGRMAWKNICAKTVSPFLLEQEFTQKKQSKNWKKLCCTSHGSAFLRHRADCCVASQGKTMTWDSKFGRYEVIWSWCFFHIWCNLSRHLDTLIPNSHQQLRMFGPVFLSLQRITTHLCRLSQPSAF